MKETVVWNFDVWRFANFPIYQLIQNQEIQAESHPDSHLTEVKDLHAELQNTLTTLQQQDPSELLDDEKVNSSISISSKY